MTHKNLIDYTNYELYHVLCRNTQTDLLELAAICSEVLRRQLAQDPEYNCITLKTSEASPSSED